ncbi:hypothetical protein Tco_0325038 [Tanacetum coccineum]
MISDDIQHVYSTQATPVFVHKQQQLYLTIRGNPQLQQDDLPIWLALKYKFERLYVATTPCRPSIIRPRDQDDAHPKGENSAKRQKTSEQGTFMFRESSSGQDFESEQGPSTSDDESTYEKVSQELVDEMSHTVDEAKLRKVIDEMLRQRCTSREEHQYHIDQMQNFLKNDIVWESRKEIIVDKCVKKFNPYAQHNVKHWKNPHAKIFYIKKQKGPKKPKEVVYSKSKIVQIIKTYWELGHEHKCITKIVARRANGSIVSITESNYKNLNKNDIEDMYLLIVNHKVDDFAKTTRCGKLSIEGQSYCTNNHFPSLSNEDVEYLQLFEEEIEERLKHPDKMRRWEMYVNGRPLGSRREHPE